MHILYEADTKGLTGTEVLAMQVLSIDDLTTEIVTGVSTHLDELDSHIVECANGWTLARMPVIDRNVLRMAVYELSYSSDVPVAVVINEAVELAKSKKPDIIVMDIKMPNLDGISAAEQMQALRIPIVLLTAFSQKELVERASEAGAMAYVVKPFTPNDLLPAIEIAWSRHQQLTALEAEVQDLTERFETRKLVDRAKGLLNEKMNLTEPEAFRWIQKASMDRRLTMHEVALTIIDQLGEKKAEPASD
jgi:response regulator NasT